MYIVATMWTIYFLLDSNKVDELSRSILFLCMSFSVDSKQIPEEFITLPWDVSRP